jgi:hypothetical protein
MTPHLDERQLNDFREGLLEPKERELVQAHLEGCPACRRELENLSKLADALAALPMEAEPPGDLWPQISWRMEKAGRDQVTQSVAEDQVEGVPSETPLLGTGRGRWVSLPAWQLLAASIALMVVSGASVWAFLSGRFETSTGTSLPSSVQSVSWEEAYGGYEEAVADLEAVLEKGRQILDPETVKVLEESLRAIDMAIEEAGEAVRQDPASPVLQRFLAENLRKKMDLLRKAATAVYANT